MRRSSLSAAAALILVWTSWSQLLAQSWDADGPNATLTLQEEDPSLIDPVNHDVTVLVNGTMTLALNSGANTDMPIILLGSVLPPGPQQGVAPLPWGGSFDVGIYDPMTGLPGGIQIVADGLNPSRISDAFARTNIDNVNPSLGSRYLLQANAGTQLDGQRLSFQGIVVDPTAPTAPAVPFDNTQAVDANFLEGRIEILGTGTGNPIPYAFDHNLTFEFHNVSYTGIFVSENGYVSFGSGTSLPNLGFSRDNIAWLNAEPAIAGIYANWNTGTPINPAAPNGNSGVLAERIGNELRLVWGDPELGQISHFASGDSNTFEISLKLNDGVDPLHGQFEITWPSLDTDLSAFDFNSGLIGHTPGGLALAGGAFDRDLNDNTGTGILSGANLAQVEEHDADGSANRLGFDGMGGARAYNALQTNKNGRSLRFIPQTSSGGLAGDLGYASQGDGATVGQPDDVGSWIGSALFTDVGGEIRELSGVFFNFDPTGSSLGTVVFDPAGLAISATVLGIHDSTGISGPLALPNPAMGQHRDGQAMRIVTPPLTGLAGNVSVQLNFANGYSETIQAFVSALSQTGSYSLGNDDVVQHTLLPGNDVSWYGTTYSDFFIGSNGQITFAHPSSSPIDSSVSCFNGFGGVANQTPGIAAPWMDIDGSLGGSYVVLEDAMSQVTVVSFFNLTEFGASVPLGSWTITLGSLGPNSAFCNWSGMTVAPINGCTIGVSDGNPGLGNDSFLSNASGNGIPTAIANAATPGMYQSSVDSSFWFSPHSIAETLPAFISLDSYGSTPGTLTFIDPLGIGDWTIY